jgi:UDP-2,4-diacetamido-2,4,6-trideoxy-beta-L-altropyranose hydrolase
LKFNAEMTPGNILIRADASPEIGTGHAMRCLALAQAWQDAGGSAMFLMAQSTPSIQARLAAENCKVLPLSAAPGSDEDADLTNECASDIEAQWLVVDGYAFGAEYQEQIRDRNRKILCVDDAGKCDRYFADIVLNQNLTAVRELYPNCLPDAELLMGPSFCLLRREFAPWRKWQRTISAKGRHVLVTLGGSTPAQAGIRVMESLGCARVEGLRAIFVAGGSSPDVAVLESCAAKFPGKISIRRDVSNMAELMAHAEVAISAAGSTCWELCLLGLPSLLLDVADNQIPVAIEMEHRGCAVYAGHGNTVEPDELAHMLENLLALPDARQSLSHHCRQLVDGLGAERVVSAMRELACESPASDVIGVRA